MLDIVLAFLIVIPKIKNLQITSKLLTQGYRYHAPRKTFKMIMLENTSSQKIHTPPSEKRRSVISRLSKLRSRYCVETVHILMHHLTAWEYFQYRILSPEREILSKSGDIIHYLCLIREIVSWILTRVIIQRWVMAWVVIQP